MFDFVKEYIASHKLLQKNDTVLVGVSGGPDSIALLHILYGLQQEYSLKLFVAHLNHMFRGEEAKKDAEFVKTLCQELQIPCFVAEEDVPAFVLEKGLSSEEGARIIRYRFFNRLVEQVGATKVALGHHADDQAETILLNLLRGSGMKGLTGMRPKRDIYIRPLLGVTRAEIEQYIKRHGLLTRIDSSNLEPIYTRNHIRLKLLPILKEKYNPNLVNILNQMAEILRVENDYLEKITIETFQKHFKVEDSQISVAKKTFYKIPLALRRRLLRLVFEKLTGKGSHLSFKTVTRIENFLNDQANKKNLGLPKEIVLKNKSEIIEFSKHKPVGEQKTFNLSLEVPGRVCLPDNDFLKGDVLISPKKWQDYKNSAPTEAYLDLDLIKLPLRVRSRKPGDVFYPLGLKNKKKIKDFFIDEKIPVQKRNHIPIVTDSGDEIIWVGGYRIDERFKITNSTQRVLYLTIKKAESGKI